jgi:hypothetical protein
MDESNPRLWKKSIPVPDGSGRPVQRDSITPTRKSRKMSEQTESVDFEGNNTGNGIEICIMMKQ